MEEIDGLIFLTSKISILTVNGDNSTEVFQISWSRVSAHTGIIDGYSPIFMSLYSII